MSAIAIGEFQRKTGLFVEDRGEQKGVIDPGDRFFKATAQDGLLDVSYQDAVRPYHDPQPASASSRPTVPDSSVDAAIAQAKASRSGTTRDRILTAFVQKNPSDLSAAQAVRLAKSACFADAKDRVLMCVFRQRETTLSVGEAIYLGSSAHAADTRDAILGDFARTNSNRLTSRDLIELAGAARRGETKDKILSQSVSGGVG